MVTELVEPPRDDFMLVAERELGAFERQERELRRQERLERSVQMFPGLAKDLNGLRS
jgi:hypothetical protein